MSRRRFLAPLLLSFAAPIAVGCGEAAPVDRIRVSGYVEATEVRIAAEVGGRLVTLRVDEGDRVEAGQVVAELDTTDAALALQRAAADRQAADAELRLLLAGSRREDVRQAAAQRDAAAADVEVARRELVAAERDLDRFEALIAANSGAEKPRDDAAARRDVARGRVRAAEERVRAATEGLARLKAGARPEEIDAARARVAVVDAELARLEKARRDATVISPVAGLVTQRLADPGELVAPRTPLLVVADLDHAWANVYVDAPFVPRVRLGQPATIHTDAGGPGIEGRVTFISPKAEFTPRNVQTAEERSKLVYRLKVTVDNRAGVLKQGMPVEAEIGLVADLGEAVPATTGAR